MTSNIGSEIMSEMSAIGFSSLSDDQLEKKEEDYKTKIKELLKDYFRPEFLNRLDDIIVFDPLLPEDVRKIVEIQLLLVMKRLEKRGVQVTFNDAVKQYIADNGFDPEFGARPVKRLIQKAVLDKLADRIIKGEIKNGAKIKVNIKGGALVFSH